MDAWQLRDFLASIFDAQDLIEVRLLPSRKQLWCNGPDEVCAIDFDEYLRERNLAGENIYFGANPRNTTGGKAENVSVARCCFVDFDNMDLTEAKRRIEAAGLPEPTAYVLSGGGVHAWWRLDEPMTDMALWTSTQKAIIRAVKSDPSIHDTPRIMRLPGYRNVKRDAMSVVAELSGRRASLADFPAGGPEPLRLHADSRPITDIHADSRLDAATFDGAQLVPALTRATVAFLTGSVPEGNRNRELFKAAADVKACGMDGSLRQGLVDAAYRHGLGAEEINLTINSAFSKDREPAKLVAVVSPAQVTIDSRSTHTPVVRMPGGMSTNEIRNYFDGPSDYETSDGNGDGGKKASAMKFGRSHGDIYNDFQRFTQDGIKRIGGILAGVGHPAPPGLVPNGSSIHWLSDPNDLFSWAGDHCTVDWQKRGIHPSTRGAITLPTPAQIYAYCKQNAVNYYGVEYMPHEPPIKGLYYAGGGIGSDGWIPPKGEGKLWELIDRLNPATDVDRVLLAAMFLTPCWGGPPGQRPMFAIDSPEFGRGTGKTTTAELLARLWGLAVRMGHEEKSEDINKRLLADTSQGSRVVIMDNVKGKRDSAGLEDMITSPSINGHRMYSGNATRPNLFTVVITSNNARLSKDLAGRAVIIHIGDARHADAGFAAWSQAFVDENRASMIGDAVEALRGPIAGTVASADRDRWSMWQDEVLCRVVGGASAAATIIERRGEVDVDTEKADEFAETIRAAIRAKCVTCIDPDAAATFIHSDALLEILKDGRHVAHDMGTEGMATILHGMMGNGPLQLLRKYRSAKDRGWTWGTRSKNQRIDHRIEKHDYRNTPNQSSSYYGR